MMRFIPIIGLVAGLIPLTAPTTAQAATIVCDRTRLSTAGFSSRSVAASWFPEQIWFEIQGARARGLYGEARVTPDGSRQILTFDAGTSTISIRFFPDQMRASAWVVPPSGYERSTPSSYACARR